jgi:TonB-linked SusC/RagA family outer membrane protein
MLSRAETRCAHTIAYAAAALLILGTPASRALAQGRTIVGRVTEARSALPVVGATLEVRGTRLGAATDAEGRYRIANVPPGAHAIVVRRIGFAEQRQTVTVTETSETKLDFALQTAAIALDQVVVTGTAGAERLREIGNSVATIDATKSVELGQPPTLTALLNARAPALVVGGITGRLGSAPSITIRGRASLGQSNSPLIYVDGVRINSSTGLSVANPSSAAQGSLFSGAGTVIAGRLNDINPEDIESIEVIKGPAAATIYGTEASAGVIQIITKKGALGTRPQFAMQVQQGSIFFRDAENRIPTNYMKDPSGTIVAWNAVTAERERGKDLFKTGHSGSYNGSISGGRDQVRYYASAAYDKETGVEPNNFISQFALHTNLNVAPSDVLDFASSVHFVDARNHLGTDTGLSAMLGAMVGHILLQPKSRGFGLGYPPELSWELYDNMDLADRFTASGTVNYRPFGWMTNRLLMGLDYTGGDTRTLERFASPELAAFLTPTQAAGRIGQTIRKNTNVTVDYAGTAKVGITSALSSSSSIGVQANRTESNSSGLGGMGFPAPGVETISGAATPLTQSQTTLLNTTVGAYAQERFGWRDRLFVTGALRVDNNSAFGEDFKWVTYPKADVSWVVNEEPFWHWSRWINTLRLRAAYGESGTAPSAFSALRTFSPIQGPGGVTAVTPGSLGNPNLKPERGKEIELGFEASILDRLTFDFTHFSKRTLDEIVNQSVAPSSGFPGSIPLNLGRVDNHGFEVVATLQAIQRRNIAWEIGSTFASNEDVIKDLGIASSAVSSCGGANRVGLPIGGFWCKRVVSADRNPTTNLATNVLCDGGVDSLGVVRPPIACAQAPFVYLGRPNPKTTGSVSNTVTLGGRLRLYGLVDFKRGNRRYLQDRELRCTGAGGAQLCEENLYPERFDPVVLAEVVGTARAQNIVDQYYTDASFAKLRELSVNYSLPSRFIPGLTSASITLSGRELHTWTKFQALDPENNGQAIIPPLTRYTATFNIRF